MGSIPITRSNMNTVISGLLGGILIGLAATLLLWSIGRIAGISGIVNGIMGPSRGDLAWRVAFVAGMMIVGAVILHFVRRRRAPRAAPRRS